MKEIVFLNKNAHRWKEFESALSSHSASSPDDIAELFIQLTDDLSFARTYYSNSETTRYLNNLAIRAHQYIYRNKKEKGSRFITYWRYEFPLLVYESKRYVLVAFAIFLISALVGALSTANDDTFVRLILGDSYVNMTLDNIDAGDPMAVYKKMNQADMFLGISFNNIRVAFLAFVLGLAVSVGSGLILMYNGIMLGSFQCFFAQKGLLWDSMLTIWIHGTLEIFAIIVAGAAGIIVGNSILFPGTYTRGHSFRKGINKGLKIVIGLVPVFILAAFFEGFVTRYTQMPDIIKITVILSSLLFIAWYFFYYPYRLNKNLNKTLKQHRK